MPSAKSLLSSSQPTGASVLRNLHRFALTLQRIVQTAHKLGSCDNQWLTREGTPYGGDRLRRTMELFDPLWKAMNVQQQGQLLRQLIEKVGYDGPTGKMTVSFRSAGLKKLCQK